MFKSKILKGFLLNLNLTLILFTGIQSTVYSQQKYTVNDIPLTWRDFVKKDVPVNQKVAAQTHVDINIDYEASTSGSSKKELTINITVAQSRQSSWVSKQFLMKAKDAESQKLLDHERLHYAINLIGFKKLYNELSEFNFTSDYVAEITSIFRRNTRYIDKMNTDYDKDTYHGVSIKNQEKWNKQIMDLFDEYYSGDKTIKTKYTIKHIIQ